MTDQVTARLAILVPQLAVALHRHHRDAPEIMLASGQRGAHHIAMLISLEMLGPATVSELADRLHISPAHASLVVGDLAKADLVERDHVPEDRRRIMVSLSEAAKPVLAKERQRRSGTLTDFVSELGAAEADQFVDHLTSLTEKLRQGPAPK